MKGNVSMNNHPIETLNYKVFLEDENTEIFEDKIHFYMIKYYYTILNTIESDFTTFPRVRFTSLHRRGLGTAEVFTHFSQYFMYAYDTMFVFSKDNGIGLVTAIGSDAIRVEYLYYNFNNNKFIGYEWLSIDDHDLVSSRNLRL